MSEVRRALCEKGPQRNKEQGRCKRHLLTARRYSTRRRRHDNAMNPAKAMRAREATSRASFKQGGTKSRGGQPHNGRRDGEQSGALSRGWLTVVPKRCSPLLTGMACWIRRHRNELTQSGPDVAEIARTWRPIPGPNGVRAKSGRFRLSQHRPMLGRGCPRFGRARAKFDRVRAEVGRGLPQSARFGLKTRSAPTNVGSDSAKLEGEFDRPISANTRMHPVGTARNETGAEASRGPGDQCCAPRRQCPLATVSSRDREPIGSLANKPPGGPARDEPLARAAPAADPVGISGLGPARDCVLGNGA